jgi:thiol:disulfide interchange protein DsbD
MDCPHTSTGSAARPRPAAEASGRRWLFALLLTLTAPGWADVNALPPDKAFRFSARALNPQTVEVRFAIAEGYYLYRDRLHFAVMPASAGLVEPTLPDGLVKEDPFFGRVQIYRGGVIVNLPLKATSPGQKVVVQVESQGCADVGLCYPPQVQQVTVALPAANAAPTRPDEPPRKSWFN